MSDETWTTYKMADGSDVWGEYGFVTELDWFEDCDDPTEIAEEAWRLVTRRKGTVYPQTQLCDDCAGEGEDDDGYGCATCDGSGEHPNRGEVVWGDDDRG